MAAGRRRRGGAAPVGVRCDLAGDFRAGQCYLEAHEMPVVQALADLRVAGRDYNVATQTGSLVLATRRGANQPLAIKSALIHVKDGYDKALFDLGPYNIPTIPPREMRSISLSTYYPGAVSIFRFSSDIVVSSTGEPDATLTLTPQSQAAPGKPGSRVPGY